MRAVEPSVRPSVERRFFALVGAAVALGTAIRLAYVLTEGRATVGGDGLAYHIVGLRLAEGLGYTFSLGGTIVPFSHHPPAWVSVLGAASWLGARSQLAHQIVTMAIGLGAVFVTGLVGRRYFDARVGVLAALIAAVYPGFWLLEVHLLSEPLDLLLLGVLTLVVADLADRPGVGRSVATGALCGLLTLVRPESLLLLVVLVAPMLLRARGLTVVGRLVRLGAAAAVCAILIAPWTIYTSSRFDEPVLLSTNGGYLLLVSNCAATYHGERLGFYDPRCYTRLLLRHPHRDLAEIDSLARERALDNMAEHWRDMPVVVPARFGRLLAVYRPSQTVRFTADWFASPQWPVWGWAASFWVLMPIAVGGVVIGRRSRRLLLPLLAPLAITVLLVALNYGEPRYHAPADLGIIVLASAGAVGLAERGRSMARARTMQRDREAPPEVLPPTRV